jgi:dienelactone hydrolase
VLAVAVTVVAFGCAGAPSGSGGTAGSASIPATAAAPASPTASPATPESSGAPTPGASIDVAAARAAFDYPVEERQFVVLDSSEDGEAIIRDVTYESAGGRTVSAFLVTPALDSTGPFPAVLFLHWYATNEPDGNRTEFLEEAVGLAEHGVVSLLPQQVFPWKTPPSGTTEDHRAVIDQVVDLRIGIDILLAQPEVDPDRLAVAGHDFGGMYAALIAGLDPRVDAAVAMAGVPHWADWFLRYWRPVPSAEQPAYKATMAEVDPVTFLPDVRGELLFQFAESDQFVNQTAIDAWTGAAGDEAVETYAWNHSLRTESARADRAAFLAAALGLAD